MTDALGHLIALDFYHRPPMWVAERLRQAGLMPRARLLREPDDDGDFPERQQQGFVLARKPVQRGGR